MANVVIMFRNPAGCEHREVIRVSEASPRKAKDDEKVLRRIRELQRDLECEILKVFVEKEKEDEGESAQ